jgi:membrane protease YdiL (CAAX protease family)
MATLETLIAAPVRPAISLGVRHPLGVILGGAAAMFVALQAALVLLVPVIGMTGAALAASGAMFLIVVAIERLAFGRGLRSGLKALGWGRPRLGAILAATLISLGMLAFFPVYGLVTGTPFALRGDWAWILVGAIVLNGLAEETLFRGFVFGHLRQAGQAFGRAGLISLGIFGAVHLYLFIGNPFAIAFLATLLAIAAAFPFAFLFERAGRVIWAGVILHVASHAFRLVDMPADDVLTVGAAWILFQFAGAFLVFAFGTTLLRRTETGGAVASERSSIAQGTAMR